MAGNTLGDLLKAGQLDMLKQASTDNKAASKKTVATSTPKTKTAITSTSSIRKTSVDDDYKIFHSYVRTVVQKSELYDTMFDYGAEESFATISELYDNPVCKDIIDYFACRFFDGGFEYLDSIATDCEHGNDKTPDEYAVVLGHKVPITYQEEYELLSLLCTTALSLDSRFDDEPIEETVIVYSRTAPPSEIVKTKHSSQTHIVDKGSTTHKHQAAKTGPSAVTKKHQPFVASEWQQFVTDHAPSQAKGEKLDDVLGKQSVQNQSSGSTEIEVQKVDKQATSASRSSSPA